ncbi:MAG: hypothetical protein ACRCSF_02250 [Mycobacteriaceae bacterium]
MKTSAIGKALGGLAFVIVLGSCGQSQDSQPVPVNTAQDCQLLLELDGQRSDLSARANSEVQAADFTGYENLSAVDPGVRQVAAQALRVQRQGLVDDVALLRGVIAKMSPSYVREKTDKLAQLESDLAEKSATIADRYAEGTLNPQEIKDLNNNYRSWLDDADSDLMQACPTPPS